MRKQDKDWRPFRHVHANCISNIPINELIEAGLPYYPIFAYGMGFSYRPQEGMVLGDSVIAWNDIDKGYWDTISRVYGIECSFVTKEDEKKVFFEKLRRLLKTTSVSCMIDCYYDPSTEYANVYHKRHHSGHGRIVTDMDSDMVYYYATHISDPEGRFSMSLDDFYLACEKFIYFKYPEKERSKEERQKALQEILFDWFVKKDYRKTFEEMGRFATDVRNSKYLGDEIEHRFEQNKVPVSKLFGRLYTLYQSRGTTVEFLQGYMDEFANNAYQTPIQHLKKSVELWNLARALLVKYGMAPKNSLQDTMADSLVEICKVEQETIAMLRDIICKEMKI